MKYTLQDIVRAKKEGYEKARSQYMQALNRPRDTETADLVEWWNGEIKKVKEKIFK